VDFTFNASYEDSTEAVKAASTGAARILCLSAARD